MNFKKQAELLQRNFGVPSYFFVEDLMPVLFSTRTTSCFRSPFHYNRYSQMEDVRREIKKSETFRELKRYLRNNFSSTMSITPIVFSWLLTSEFRVHLYVYKDLTIIEELIKLGEEFRRAYDNSTPERVDETYYTSMLHEASLLGIPKCCANRYVKERREIIKKIAENFDLKQIVHKRIPEPTLTKLSEMAGMSDRRARKQLSEVVGKDVEKDYMSYEDFKRLPEELLLSYFAFEVYPCEPGCKEAVKVGHRILSGFEDSSFLYSAYKYVVLPLNAYRVWSGSRLINFIIGYGSENVLKI